MNPFKTFTGIVAPLDRSNIDTDSIIPKQYLKSIKRSGFGVNLFDDWRYLDPGNPGDDHTKRRINTDFILNQKRYKDANILITRENFGCGSSREHAVWALMDYGFRVVIAPGYADIFYSNSFKNGFLPIVLDTNIIDRLFAETFAKDGYTLTIDLEQRSVITLDGTAFLFTIDLNLQKRLLQGLDEISITLHHADEIKSYEKKRQMETPWFFPDAKTGD
ncbi:MAG: 3-isopropylmalate dehydratase small subunit [Gammaproteobacteria bacterium]|nr:3-isopropylmalate dehydratase small subunit [Gammaproteobacteria bacterium]